MNMWIKVKNFTFLSTTFWLNFGTVLMVWYFLFSRF